MSTVARRSFLSGLAAGIAAPAVLRAQARTKRLPIAFSTLGCPQWSWKAILEAADRLGYAGIELRGIAGEMDLPKVPEFQGSRLAETKRDLAALGIVISDLGASSRMHEKDKATREKQLDEGRRFIDLAQAMGVPYVRMFGDKLPPDEPREKVLKRVVEGFQQMSAYAKAAGVTVLIETHGDFTSSADLEQILTRVGSSNFALLWDAYGSFVAGQEKPSDTYAKLGAWVRHRHIKDSRPAAKGARIIQDNSDAFSIDLQACDVVDQEFGVADGIGYPLRDHNPLMAHREDSLDKMRQTNPQVQDNEAGKGGKPGNHRLIVLNLGDQHVTSRGFSEASRSFRPELCGIRADCTFSRVTSATCTE